jgi:hypothetical protein
VKTLDYATPERKRKPFFARPFWRDWLLGGTLLFIGLLILPSKPTEIRFPSYAMLILGALILLCAAIHAIGVLFRWWTADNA